MYLHRSQKAKDELAAKSRTLHLKERSALFVADGRKTKKQLQHLLNDDAGMLQKLIDEGYLVASEAGEPGADGNEPVSDSVMDVQGAQALPPPSAAVVLPVTPLAAGDNFDGKRSLATTRMFLFDICERMFVRKRPELAKHYRDQLREARDRASMMAIARDIIINVEELAGPERADGLSERIAMLLPLEPA